MTENIAKDTNKSSKAGIALIAAILGGPFIYLGLVLVVLNQPEVMTSLGLKPFVEYLIQLQSGGYENLVRLNSPAFADYFFHFHAATVLISVISVIFVIAILICSRASFMNHNIHESLKKLFQEKKIVETPLGKVKMTPARLTLYSLLLGGGVLHANLTWPYWAGSGKFYVGNGGMGIFIVLSMLNMMLILMMISLLYILMSFHYWPKFRSWLN